MLMPFSRLHCHVQVVALPASMHDLLDIASRELGCVAHSIHFPRGGEVTDISVIRDEDELLVSTCRCAALCIIRCLYFLYVCVCACVCVCVCVCVGV